MGSEMCIRDSHSSANVDVVSFHEYDGGTLSNHFPTAIKVANTLNKPLFVGETGQPYGSITTGQSRADFLKKRFDGYLAGGAAGVLPWNYGQGNYGGWTIFPGDASATMVSNYKISGIVTTPTPTPTTPTTPTNPTPTPAGCSLPTNFGTATNTVSVPAAGTYVIWTRMMAPNNTANSYALDIDNAQCITVGDSSAMAANTWNWVNYRDGAPSTPVSVNLTAGSHTFKLIGREAGVKIDRILALADATCVPNGVGNNCTNSADAVAPTVRITAPASGASVKDTVAVTATATDNIAVTKVEVLVDNAVKSTLTAAPYTYQLNTASLSNGSHTVSVKAYDAAGNVSAVSTSITVSNGDTTAPSAPAGLTANATAFNSVSLNWTASNDNVGIAHYLVTRNGTVIATVNATSYVDASASANTTYSYQVKAYDAAGNASPASSAVSVRTPIAPTQDTAAPSAPATVTASSVSTSQINVTWTASTDNVAVAGYDVYRSPVGGTMAKVASVTGTQFGDTGLKAGTYYRYHIIARDGSGNQSTASPVANATTLAESSSAGVIRGVVKGKGGALSGVSVVAWSSEGKQYNASTNGSGVYRLDNLPNGWYWITYSANGHRANDAVVEIKNNTVIKDIGLTSNAKRWWWQWWR